MENNEERKTKNKKPNSTAYLASAVRKCQEEGIAIVVELGLERFGMDEDKPRDKSRCNLPTVLGRV